MVDTKEILSLLPHRYPLLLVDRVIELEPNNRVVGIKNVTINEPFFQGHFPDNPIMPGVLIVEAMAQAAGILALKSSRAEGKKTVYFMSIEKVKFRRPVLPGDQLRLEIQVAHTRGNVWKFSGNTFVGDRLTTEAEFIVMIADEEL